jgi:5-methyltetrahydropteroyltriglutamate--homocysteine methyltransferase
VPGREPGGEEVEFPPDGDQLDGFRAGEVGDHHVAVRDADDQVIGFEPPQGLPQGSDGDAQGCRELYVVDPAARLQLALENLVAQLQVGTVGLGCLAAGGVAVRHGMSEGCSMGWCTQRNTSCPLVRTIYYKILPGRPSAGSRRLRRDALVRRSTDRILTTHTGSIARPDDLIELMRARENGRPYDRAAFEARATEAVAECVRRQVEAGLDVINDGEQRKSGFTTYLAERLAGFDAVPYAAGEARGSWPEVAEFPEYYERYFKTAMFGAMLSPPARLVCRGPVTYVGQEALAIDIANLRAALSGAARSGAGLARNDYTEVFMSAALPTGLAEHDNEYYASREEFITALADATREEYRAIIDAGFLIQLDDPAAARLWGYADAEPDERARRVAQTVELINYTLRDIPPEKIRYHTCYGINQGPHIYDLRLRDFIEPMLAINAQAFSFEVMNPRHMHDYHAFEDVKLPAGKIIIPGMLSNGANWVEHPELIAELTVRYAELVGRESVMIGNDCGFASQAATKEIDPKVGWAKFSALAEGARIASKRLWG